MRHRKLDAPYRLDRKASWTAPEMIRFIGLQGKRIGIEQDEADRTDRSPHPEATGRPAGSIGGDWRSNPRDSPILPALPAFF